MKNGHLRMTAASALLAVVFSFTACTDALLEPQPEADNRVSPMLTIRGNVCASPPDPSGFPVKVVLVVDQSGSMCISDPPGSQGGYGFCERLVDQGIVPAGLTEPARVRALRRLVTQFRAMPNVQISVVPFETNVRNVWPTNVIAGTRFARPDSSLDTYVANLQTQLGKGTDYQGALAYAYSLISSDILYASDTNPEVLPRTRYVVVFLTDGTPYPRCSANDNLASYADPTNPQLTWADSSSADDFCDILDPTSPDNITGFVPGTDRNQNYQLFNYVDRLMELKEAYNIGDIRMHTVLLFNQAAVEACGPICQDVYGTYPGVTTAGYPAAAHAIAEWTLQQMAERGNGVFQEFLNGDIQSLGLGGLDYSSLASPWVMKSLLLQPMRSVPFEGVRVVDFDGDGIHDDHDIPSEQGTFLDAVDSDLDCFSDAFEIRRQHRGFDPDVGNDVRSCGTAPTCLCSDTDGDGLTQYEENFLGTRRGLVDTDGDAVPDQLEARYGLDAIGRAAADLDTDGDTLPDAREHFAGTDPTFRDPEFYDRDGFQYEIRAVDQGGSTTCYDFSISNIRMVTPPGRPGFYSGHNRFKLWFAEAPASGVSTDYGVWRTACVTARYSPPTVRDPLIPEVNTLTNASFVPPNQLQTEDQYRWNCEGATQWW